MFFENLARNEEMAHSLILPLFNKSSSDSFEKVQVCIMEFHKKRIIKNILVKRICSFFIFLKTI